MQNDNDDDDDYGRALQGSIEQLRNNEPTEFVFSWPPDDTEDGLALLPQATVAQAKEALRALMANTSVNNLYIHLDFFPLESIPLLLQYIQSSSTQLHQFTVDYGRNDDKIKEQYQSQIGQVFHAISRNPTIEELTVHDLGSNPSAIYDLLSKTKTLRFFKLELRPVPSGDDCSKMARHVARGLAESSSIDKVLLWTDDLPMVDDLDFVGVILTDGIARSKTIQTLQLCCDERGLEYYESLTKFLFKAPSTLKTLALQHATHTDPTGEDAGLFNRLLLAFGQPGCAPGLEKLIFINVDLQSPAVPAANRDDDDDVVVAASSSSITTPVPVVPQANRSIKILFLRGVWFSYSVSERPLLNFVGLKELQLNNPIYKAPDDNDEEEDDDDELSSREHDDGEGSSHVDGTGGSNGTEENDEKSDHGEEGEEETNGEGDDDNAQANTHYWAGLIRRNPNLEKAVVVDDEWDFCMKGIVEGAYGHMSLKTLQLSGINDGMRPELELDESVGADLSQLLHRQTGTPLEVLTLSFITIMQAGAEQLKRGICTNDSVQRLEFNRCKASDGLNVWTIVLESLLINQTVKKLCFADRLTADTVVDDDNDVLAFCETLSSVFRVNKSLEIIRLPTMSINAGNMRALAGLVPNDVIIKSIDFSSCTLDPDALHHLLRNLSRMKSIERVAIQETLDAEGKRLLLQAVQEKKTLMLFTRSGVSVNDSIDTKIDFYLKLNKFGRRIFDSSNVEPANFVWPLLFSRMATSDEESNKNSNMDALIFFLEQYFSNGHHKKLQASTCKRIRLE